jgi:hypothetical protein
MLGWTVDRSITTATWWDALFYNRRVDRIYVPANVAPMEQSAPAYFSPDKRTGALPGLPGGYLLVSSRPVFIGLRDAQRLANYALVDLVRVPPKPRAAFVLDVPDGSGMISPGHDAPLRIYPTGTARHVRVAFTAMPMKGPLRLTITDRRGRRLVSQSLAVNAPATVKFTTSVPSSAPADLQVRADTPRQGALPDAVVQALDVQLSG